MTYELKHSPLRLPHGRLQVTGKRAHRTRDGEAFAATVRLDNAIVGTIENEGTGGETRFVPGRPASAIPDRVALWNELVMGAEFTRASVTSLRATDSGEVPAEYVADALVTEYEISTWLAAVSAAGQGSIRSFDPSLGLSTTYITYSAPAGYKPAHDRVLIGQLKAEEREEGDIWQVWTGEAWKDLTEAPTADEDDTKYAIFRADTDEQLAGPMDYWTAVDWVVEHREEHPNIPVTARIVEKREG